MLVVFMYYTPGIEFSDDFCYQNFTSLSLRACRKRLYMEKSVINMSEWQSRSIELVCEDSLDLYI